MTDFSDFKWLPHPPVWPEGLVFIHEIQRLCKQQQSDQGQLQVRSAESGISLKHKKYLSNLCFSNVFSLANFGLFSWILTFHCGPLHNNLTLCMGLCPVSHDYSFIVSGSEDKYVYIWSTYHDLSKFTSVRRDRNDFWEAIKGSCVWTSLFFLTCIPM